MAGPKNTNKDKINLSSFIGGTSTDFKYGTANSFYDAKALDFRSKPSQMSVLPGAYNITSNLSDLPTCMVQDPTGARYAVGDKGAVYRINTSNVVSKIAQMTSNGGAGIVYNQLSDQLYFSGQQTVSMYGQLSSSPQFRSDNFGVSASLANAVIYTFNTNTTSYDGGTYNGVSTQRNNLNTLTSQGVTPTNYTTYVTNTLTNTYTIPNTINENSGNFCAFVPDIEPFYSVAVWLTNIGTGDLTLTMHDSLNNSLGTATITHANAVVGWNNFIFSTPGIRAKINAIAVGTSAGYHFHLTSSVASDTATVATINSNDLTGANFVLFAYRLVKTNNGWHPIVNFAQYLCIGNGPYLSTYNYGYDINPSNTFWVRHQLIFDIGYEVCGLSVNNQYLVIAAEKRSTSGTRSYQDGYLYFWDGVSQNYNFKIEIPMGAPYGLTTFNNITYFYCAGSLFAWGGGQQVIKVRPVAYQNTDYLGTTDNTIVNPNMMDIRYNLLMLGYPSTTTNTSIPYGVYSWGAVELTYPNSFGYSYALANNQQYTTGVANNNLRIGMVRNFVDTMYISWSYVSGGTTYYGIDVVDNTSTPASNFSFQSLIWDGGVRYKTKKALRLKIAFLPLPAGTSLTAQYNKDRTGWISADPISGNSYTASTGDISLVVEFDNMRFMEFQWGFFGTSSSSATTPPTITGVTLEVDPLEDELSLKKDFF